MEDVYAVSLVLVRFFSLGLEIVLVAIALIGCLLTGGNWLLFCFFRMFFLVKLFWETALTAFA